MKTIRATRLYVPWLLAGDFVLTRKMVVMK